MIHNKNSSDLSWGAAPRSIADGFCYEPSQLSRHGHSNSLGKVIHISGKASVQHPRLIQKAPAELLNRLEEGGRPQIREPKQGAAGYSDQCLQQASSNRSMSVGSRTFDNDQKNLVKCVEKLEEIIKLPAKNPMSKIIKSSKLCDRLESHNRVPDSGA